MAIIRITLDDSDETQRIVCRCGWEHIGGLTTADANELGKHVEECSELGEMRESAEIWARAWRPSRHRLEIVPA